MEMPCLNVSPSVHFFTLLHILLPCDRSSCPNFADRYVNGYIGTLRIGLIASLTELGTLNPIKL